MEFKSSIMKGKTWKQFLAYRSERCYMTYFLVDSVSNDKFDKISSFIETLYKKPPSKERKEALFEAEKHVLTDLLAQGNIEHFKKLLGVFENFYQRTPELKDVEFKVLTDAVNEAQRYVIGNKEYLDAIHNIINKSYNDLREKEEFEERFREIDKLCANSLSETTY